MGLFRRELPDLEQFESPICRHNNWTGKFVLSESSSTYVGRDLEPRKSRCFSLNKVVRETGMDDNVGETGHSWEDK